MLNSNEHSWGIGSCHIAPNHAVLCNGREEEIVL